MWQGLRARARIVRDLARLPVAAHAERRRDRAGLPAADPGSERVLEALIDWLARAQDRSKSADGGVARDFSLIKGWASSYPETTGYIVPTVLDFARLRARADVRERGRRMTDWLVRIQLPEGAFQGGKIDSVPCVPVTFNTGQVLLGLAAAETEFGAYREPMRRAADWLVKTQDPDGCWRNYPSPFTAAGEKEYETHVAWGLIEAARLEPGRGYGESALANVRWALSSQGSDGWFPRCCLDQATRPLTHTIAYALRGVLEAYRFSAEPSFLAAARRTADGLLSGMTDDGKLAGRFEAGWKPSATWVCLTGSAQTAHCALLLHRLTGETRYLEAGRLLNRFVRRTVRLDGPPDTRGGVKGSFPIDGEYGRYEYLDWGVKFLADSLMLEMELDRH
ncbi:MAG TPA: hypothetical protein VH328_00210 [Burkholderiaceae bacterium]|nr:hypothetical protein [Burkholderiaceae bacterium]